MSKDMFFQMRQDDLAHLIEEVEQGNKKALPIYAQIKELKELCTVAERQIEPIAFEEAEQYPDKTFQEAGFSFTKKNGSTRYKYTNISKWQEKHKELKGIEEQAKQAYIAKQKGLLTASKDGEEIELPEVTYTKSSIAVKRN